MPLHDCAQRDAKRRRTLQFAARNARAPAGDLLRLHLIHWIKCFAAQTGSEASNFYPVQAHDWRAELLPMSRGNGVDLTGNSSGGGFKPRPAREGELNVRLGRIRADNPQLFINRVNKAVARARAASGRTKSFLVGRPSPTGGHKRKVQCAGPRVEDRAGVETLLRLEFRVWHALARAAGDRESARGEARRTWFQSRLRASALFAA